MAGAFSCKKGSPRMVSLAEAVNIPSSGYDKRRRCYTQDWIKDLPPEEQTAARTLLADPNRLTSDLLVLFQENGYPLAYDSLGRHRGGRCSCLR